MNLSPGTCFPDLTKDLGFLIELPKEWVPSQVNISVIRALCGCITE